MTDLDTLIAAHPDAVTSVRTHDGHVVSHTVIVDTDTGRQAHTFDADGALIERTIDHGDGTGTRTTYRPDGTVDTVEHLTGLPIPDPEPPADDPLAAADVARAIVRPLETLTGGSTSTATRNALLSVRAELDRLIEG